MEAAEDVDEEDADEVDFGDEALAANLVALLGKAEESEVDGVADISAAAASSAVFQPETVSCQTTEMDEEPSAETLEAKPTSHPDLAQAQCGPTELDEDEEVEEESARSEESMDEDVDYALDAADSEAARGSEHIDAENEAERGQSDNSGAEDGEFFLDVDGGSAGDNGAAVTESDAELIAVPATVAQHLLGQDSEELRRIAEACGAKLLFIGAASRAVSDRMLQARGAPGAVAAVRRTLHNLAEELSMAQPVNGRRDRKRAAEAAPGEGAAGAGGMPAGICKWFAAGFCRNCRGARGPPSEDSCSNGVHKADAALAAEAAWVAAGPRLGAVRPARLPVLLLLDLEGGGNKDGRDGEDEIIEVPVLAMCPVSGAELGRFHRFARPSFWSIHSEDMQKRYPARCFNQASSAIAFPRVLAEMQDYISDVVHGPPSTDTPPRRTLRVEDFLFVTCGNWDVKTVMPRQCKKPFPGAVPIETQKLLLSRWCNLKEVFRDHFKLSESAAPTGMRGMLRRLNIALSGQHHLGMDDVSNLAKILRTLVLQGAALEPTGSVEAVRPPPQRVAQPLTGLVANAAPPSAIVRQPGVSALAAAVEASKRAVPAPASAAVATAVGDEPKGPRTGRGILEKYSNSARAEALGQDVFKKGRVPAGGQGAPVAPAALAKGGRKGKGGAPNRRMRGSPSLLSGGKAGKRR